MNAASRLHALAGWWLFVIEVFTNSESPHPNLSSEGLSSIHCQVDAGGHAGRLVKLEMVNSGPRASPIQCRSYSYRLGLSPCHFTAVFAPYSQGKALISCARMDSYFRVLLVFVVFTSQASSSVIFFGEDETRTAPVFPVLFDGVDLPRIVLGQDTDYSS